MFNRLNLGAKFTLLLALVLLAGMALSWFALSGALQSKAEREVVSQAQILLKTMNSVRQYTSENVNQHVKPLLDQNSQFISETVPGYSARQVFDFFRKDKAYKDYLYKEATLNPTNPLNKADSFETSLFERFRQEPDLPEQVGFREIEGRSMFFTARPIRIKSASCLECHSVPAAAPASMIKKYGEANGFGWKLNEVVGSQIVYVPADAVFSAGHQSAVLVTGIFVAIFGLAAIAVTIFFRHVVVRPLGGLAAATQALTRGSRPDTRQTEQFAGSSDLDNVAATAARGDEIGQLAERFNFMKREVESREARVRQAQADVARSEAHFRSLIEHASDAVLVLDASLQVRYASPSLQRVLGFAPDAVVGKSAMRCVHERDADATRRVLEAAAAKPGVGRSFEFRGAGDGAPTYLEATVANMLDNPAVEGIVVNMRDATERHRTEELTRDKIQAQQANKLKGQFLANMSHEIRTPMNGILGMTELLLAASLDEQPRRFAEAIRHSGESLLGIINDILDFSKIEAGKLELENIPFNLQDIVQDVAELLAERAHKKGLELACHIHADVPVHIHGDPGRLRQVLTNLLSNAVKFTDHGEVVMEVTCIPESRAHADDARARLLHFSVADTGIGIAREKTGTLFQSFTQADNSTTRKHGGTGLGLAISKQLVEMMGGEIGLRSEAGQGSCFHFTVRTSIAADPAPSAAAPREHLDGMRVLIAEDNPTNRTILSSQLAGWGMRNGSAENGTQALEMLRSAAAQNSPYDLAIIDMKMPGMNGIELARAIKADAMTANVRIIMLSSTMSPGEAESAREAGIVTYLSKPVRQSELRRAVAEAAGVALQRAQRVVLSVERRLDARVLLAEDNAVNQEVALAMLESMGCEVVVAQDGIEAVAAAGRSRFDLILMDCQMPEMDGFAATRELRRLEAACADAVRVPVIALTANAMEGDRERCLAAGMDDYLAKPFRKEQLARIMTEWIKRSRLRLTGHGTVPVTSAQRAPEIAHAREQPAALRLVSSQPAADVMRTPDEAATAAAIDSKALDNIRALQGLGAPDLLDKIVNLYLDDAPRLVRSIHDAIAAGDSSALQRAAHTLKSSSANLGALKLADLCREIEAQARAGRLADASQWLGRIEREYARVRAELPLASTQSPPAARLMHTPP